MTVLVGLLQSADIDGVFSDVEDAAWKADMADIPDYAFNAAAASATRAVILDGDLSRAAETLSQNTGMDAIRAAEVVENGVWAQRQIVDRAVSKVGLPPEQLEAFYEHCRGNPSRLQNAVQYLLAGRDVSQFQQMAREFVAASGK